MLTFLVFIVLAATAVIWVVVRSRPQGEPEPVFVNSPSDPAIPSDSAANDSSDSCEGGFWSASEPRDLEVRLDLTYKDGQGATTRRIVRTRSFDNALYGGILIGHCELRNALRTFRFDRIVQAIDVSTGEVLSDVRAHLNQLYAGSPQAARDSLQEEYADLLEVLLFVARADGQFREAEKIIARRYLRDSTRDPRVSDEMIDGLFSQLQTPSLNTFKRAVGRVISAQLVDPALLQQICREMIATQKSVSAGEKEAMSYIERRAARYAGTVANVGETQSRRS